MSETTDLIARKIATLPDTPGVYLWKDAEGKTLYVGKAKRLRSRVRSYLQSDHIASVKTQALMRKVADVDTIVVPSEAHALVLEANLIKEYRPRFNIALRDDKSYPYIRVTVQEPFPRVFVTRRLVNDGSRYFGPYTDVAAMRRALNVVSRIFTIRSCSYDMPAEMPQRPCLDYHIGRCKAPCIGAQTEAEYRAMIDEVLLFLDGRTAEVRRRVRARMDEAATRLDFERAAELRNALKRLEEMEEPTVVVDPSGGDRDVVGFARDGDDACLTILRFRDGRLLARDHAFVENITDEPDEAVLAAYLVRTYLSAEERAPQLLVPFPFEDLPVLEESLAGTTIRVPQRGAGRELITLADRNARHLLEELKLGALETAERAADPVYELQRVLGLQKVPRALVCFDISTAQGTDTVGSCVWVENGRPRRAEYRKFRVETVEGTDDFAAMREVVSRYFRRRLDEAKPLPDLVVVDGGKGQLGVAREALAVLGLDEMPVISLAKRDEEIFVPGSAEPVRLTRRSPALRLLQRARDEAHRFAITYNRKRRTMRTVTSELMRLRGIGPKKRSALLRAFGSLAGVRAASPEQIAALPGFTMDSARRLLDSLRDSSPVPEPEPPGEPDSDDENPTPTSSPASTAAPTS